MKNDGHGHLVNIPSAFVSNTDGLKLIETLSKCNDQIYLKQVFDVFETEIVDLSLWLNLNNVPFKLNSEIILRTPERLLPSWLFQRHSAICEHLCKVQNFRMIGFKLIINALLYSVIPMTVLALNRTCTASQWTTPIQGTSFLAVSCSRSHSECICCSICCLKTRTQSGSITWTSSTTICVLDSRTLKLALMRPWSKVEFPTTSFRPSNKMLPTL